MHRTRLQESARGFIRGFTLIELMVTIAVAATLMAIAFPSFKSSMQSNEVSTATNELLASFALARSEAIRSNAGAGICASADGASCGADWNSGWLVWTDTNSDGLITAGEPIIRYSQARAKTTITGPAAAIVFDSRGRATGGAHNVDLKPSDGAYPERCLSMNVTGQTSVKKQACP